VVSVHIVTSIVSRKSDGITKGWNHSMLFRPGSEERPKAASRRMATCPDSSPSFETHRFAMLLRIRLTATD
jgi:hypothetical protein